MTSDDVREECLECLMTFNDVREEFHIIVMTGRCVDKPVQTEPVGCYENTFISKLTRKLLWTLDMEEKLGPL